LCEHALFMVGEIGGNDYNYAIFQGKSMDEMRQMVPQVVDAILNGVRVYRAHINLLLPLAILSPVTIVIAIIDPHHHLRSPSSSQVNRRPSESAIANHLPRELQPRRRSLSVQAINRQLPPGAAARRLPSAISRSCDQFQVAADSRHHHLSLPRTGAKFRQPSSHVPASCEPVWRDPALPDKFLSRTPSSRATLSRRAFIPVLLNGSVIASVLSRALIVQAAAAPSFRRDARIRRARQPRSCPTSRSFEFFSENGT
ncbi:GDSL esterase/lipase, partial [Striga hermonthica]